MLIAVHVAREHSTANRTTQGLTLTIPHWWEEVRSLISDTTESGIRGRSSGGQLPGHAA
jgi:hypothetical protein